MSRIRRGTMGLLLVGGVCLALTGCWEKESSPTSEVSPSPDTRTAQKAALEQQRQQALKDHHQVCYETFLKHPANGISRMGPIHPSITYPRSLQLPAGADVVDATPAGQPLPEGTAPWKVEKIELVSLMMNDKPAVYQADGEVKFRRPKTRGLDEFEEKALPVLQGGEQVVILDAPGEVRMLGAIRATKDCLKCHSDRKEGDLLGALTYQIKPVGK